MLAIPSPDIFVNLFASAAQVFGLLTVMLGGTLFRRRRRANGPQAVTSGGGGRATILFGVLFAGTAVSLVLYVLNVNERDRQRLRTNLLRSSKEAGKSVGDTSLKTLSVSGQMEHPRGVATGTLAEWLDGPRPPVVIDVRESEEVERGAVRGSEHHRYPDIQHDPRLLDTAQDAGSRIVLMCYSGNRSSELVDWLTKQGRDVRFVVGGYEKWIAEGHPLAGAESRKALRELPEHPGHDILLDTDEVLAAVQEQGAIFVDVRYPGDFERGHLPDAICIPLRKLTSPEVEAALAALPDRPVIAPCYDKRSSFYASILGVRLHRMGRTLLGRYTVPHEYALPSKESAWTAEWNRNQAGTSPWTMLKAGLAAGVSLLRDVFGSLLLAVVVFVLAIRLAMLGLSYPADVDQWRRKTLTPEITALRARLRDDPVRAEKAIAALVRRAGIRPVRNLLTSLVLAVVFIALFAAVADLVVGTGETFLTLSLEAADATLITPMLIGALLLWIVLAGAPDIRRAGRGRWIGAAASAVLFAVLTWTLPLILNLYLLVNLLWIAVQGDRARRRVQPPWTQPRKIAADRPVPLARAADLPDVGNKALRLAQMAAAGLPVPDGFCIPATALRDGMPSERLLESCEAQFAHLNATAVAVRSSGLKEDGADHSYAGVFDSILNVDRQGLRRAVHRVVASFHSQRASTYSATGEEPAAILVQRMVDADYAGVMFTEHPATTGALLIEMVAGLGEDLVSGKVSPDAYCFGRYSGTAWDDATPPIDLAPLRELGRRVEKLFGRPQDIEWAFADGRFYILQSRDITSDATGGDSVQAIRELRRRRLLSQAVQRSDGERVTGDTIAFAQDELTELLPAPTPFSRSLMESLWAPGGTVDRASRSLGFPYEVAEDAPPLLVDLFGTTAVDVQERSARSARRLSMTASFQLARMADSLEADLRERFIPAIQRRTRLMNAVDLKQLERADLFSHYEETLERFVFETYVEAERINIAAAYYLDAAVRRLKKAGLDPASYLSDMPHTVVHAAMTLLTGPATPAERHREFLEVFGHRAAHDFELSEPRYAENDALVARMAARGGRGIETGASAAATAPLPKLPGRMLEFLVQRAQRFQVLKEEAKHYAMRELALLRSILLEIGRRTTLGDDVFWLVVDEIAALVDSAVIGVATARADARRNRREAFAGLSLPVSLTVAELERSPLGATAIVGTAARTKDAEATLAGTWIAGESEICGYARVCRSVADIDDFQPGDILVARFTDPTWTTVFPLASGVITEVGGWLSHAAILAREYHLPAIVGAKGALDQLQDGDMVRLRKDGVVEIMVERRQSERSAFAARICIEAAGQELSGICEDLSRSGAQVRLFASVRLEPGTRVTLQTSHGQALSAHIVRRADSANGLALGLAFLQPLTQEMWQRLSPSQSRVG